MGGMYSGIKLTNFKWFAKNEGAEDAKATAVVKILGLHELFCPCFLAFVKKFLKNYQRKSSTLKHAVVDNN